MGSTPREVALRMLSALFAAPVSADGADRSGPACSLADFQTEGVARLRAVLDRWGGAVLADSVGLGKTYIALALIEETLRASGDAVVVVPAATRRHWRRALRRLPAAGGGWRLLSHTQLARGARIAGAPGGGSGRRLVVVDEAHRFRNPATARYGALARLVAGETRALFLTATPVNNHVEDLLHLIRLFAADDAFRHLGVPSLRDAFLTRESRGSRGTPDAADGVPGGREPARAATVVRAVVVRRTRAMVRDRFGEAAPLPAAARPGSGQPYLSDGAGSYPLRFPRRAPPRLIRYTDPALPGLVASLADLELGPYTGFPRHTGGAGSAALIRLGLLKRLDSSPAAFRASLGRLTQILRATLDAARAGRVLAAGRPASGRRTADGDPLQLSLVELVARPAPPDLDLDALARSVERDLRRVRELGRMRGAPALPAVDLAIDSKLMALHALLEETRDEKTLIFTEYRDTADALWRHLSRHHLAGRVDGSGAWLGRRRAGRRAVVERFAPVANGRRPPPARERVDVLIATDVLAEGLNLQDARHVVSYELPWNPVRLLQRIGRVDRLGSPHADIVPYLFAPQEGVEAMLGLTRRVRTKLGHIASTVGAEQAVELLDRLATASHGATAAGSLEAALERADSGPADPMEELRTLWIRNRGSQGAYPDDDRRCNYPAKAAIHVPSGSPGASIAWVVLVQHRGAPTLLEIDRGGAVGEAGSAARYVLELAASGTPGADFTGEVPVERIAGYLARADGAACGPPRLCRRDPGLRLARRLRRTMAHAGAGLDPHIVARADALLQRIAAPLDPAREATVRSFLDHHHNAPITALLELAETALADRAGHPSLGESDGRSHAVVAALQIHDSDTPSRG